MSSSNEIWIFLSHSNKDYEKVRQVRNLLEEQSLRPLMFFLHCLNDDDEIDSLIKREIDCRTRFILCDSENARKSCWVQKEVDYIKSQNRICETIDLSKGMDEILSSLQDFINKTRLFISYNREEFPLADIVYNRLSKYDFSVYIDKAWDFSKAYHQDYKETLNALEDTVVKTNGYVIAILNDRVLSSYSCSRHELTRAIRDNKNFEKVAPNIIPFVSQKSLIDLIAQDGELSPLAMCNIQSIEGYTPEQQCDVIIERIVTQLMTPGSIRVQAENFKRELNTKEASFLDRLLKDIEKNLHKEETIDKPKFEVLRWVGTHFTGKFDQASISKGYLNFWFEYSNVGEEFFKSQMEGFVSGFKLVSIRNKEFGLSGTNFIFQVDPQHYVPIPGVEFKAGESVIGVQDCDFSCIMKVSFRPSLDTLNGSIPLYEWEI